jgi:hypothetical protein
LCLLILASLSITNLPLPLFVNLQLRKTFLLIHNLTLHTVLGLQLEILMAFFLFILLLYYISLLRLFTLGKEDCLLNLTFLLLSLLVYHVVLGGLLPLLLIIQLEIVNFLHLFVN